MTSDTATTIKNRPHMYARSSAVPNAEPIAAVNSRFDKDFQDILGGKPSSKPMSMPTDPALMNALELLMNHAHSQTLTRK